MQHNADEYARWNGFRADISRLRSTAVSTQQAVDAATDIRGIVRTCHDVWMFLESLDLFLHDFLVEEHVSSDARAADPLEAIRTYLDAARAQVTEVLSSEYVLDVARNRLAMSLAVSETVLDVLSAFIEELATPRA